MLTLTLLAYEIFENATSDSLVQYFIYFIGGPVSYSYGGPILAIN